jgi:hypothetical protein
MSTSMAAASSSVFPPDKTACVRTDRWRAVGRPGPVMRGMMAARERGRVQR